jgi:hypothetical protein
MNRRGLLGRLRSFCGRSVGRVPPRSKRAQAEVSGERTAVQRPGQVQGSRHPVLNALKIDKNFADAHYALAQTYLHMGQFSSAYGELLRTVDLQPDELQGADRPWKPAACRRQDRRRARRRPMRYWRRSRTTRCSCFARPHCRPAGTEGSGAAEIHRALELAPNRAAFHETSRC